MSPVWVLVVFFGYFATLIGIAGVRARQMREMSDYVLGRRNVGSFTSALSSASSSTSGWTMLVFPALAFTNGLVEMWSVLAIAVTIWMAWAVMAKRLRRYTIATDDALTLPEFFEKRFDDRTGIIRTVSALITLFFITFYVSSGLIAGSKLLETTFGLDPTTGALLTMFAVASYTFIGGFLAVSQTDVFQALVMLGGFMVIPLTLLVITDNPFHGVGSAAPGFWNPFTDAGGTPITPAFLITASGWGLGTFGSQRILQRFMAVESEAKIVPSRNMSTLWTAVIFSFGVLLGMVSFPALSNVGMLAAVADPERLYIVVSEVFFHPVISGFLLTGVIAAIMSTADSQLLLGSAVATDDLPLVRRLTYSLGGQSRVWLGRLMLVIISAIAAALSIFNPDSVFALVSYAWGGMGAAFGPCTLLSLYWRRFNRAGALASILVGTAAASLWGSFSGGPWGVLDAEPGTPGFVAATLAAVIVTLLTRPPSPEIADRFDRVVAPRTGARGSAVSPTEKPFSAGVRQSSNLKLTMFPISPSPSRLSGAPSPSCCPP